MNGVHLAHQHEGKIVDFRHHINSSGVGHFQSIERTVGNLRCKDIFGIGRQYEGHAFILSFNPDGCGPFIFHKARPVHISPKRDQRHTLVSEIDIHLDKF